MLSSEAYLQARQKARYHVQVQIERVGFPPRMPGEAEVGGKVVQVFRADGSELRCGDPIRFRLSVAAYNEALPPEDGVWWLPADAIYEGACIEAFLNGEAPDCAVALWQVTILEGAPSPPWMSEDTLD